MRRRGFKVHAFVYVVVNAVVWGIWTTVQQRRETLHLWPWTF